VSWDWLLDPDARVATCNALRGVISMEPAVARADVCATPHFTVRLRRADDQELEELRRLTPVSAWSGRRISPCGG
jgi:hypothetical protein